MVEGVGAGGDRAVASPYERRELRSAAIRIERVSRLSPCQKNTNPKPQKKIARGASETRRGLKGSLLLEEINLNYKVIYKSHKPFLGVILFFGADNPMCSK